MQFLAKVSKIPSLRLAVRSRKVTGSSMVSFLEFSYFSQYYITVSLQLSIGYPWPTKKLTLQKP